MTQGHCVRLSEWGSAHLGTSAHGCDGKGTLRVFSAQLQAVVLYEDSGWHGGRGFTLLQVLSLVLSQYQAQGSYSIKMCCMNMFASISGILGHIVAAGDSVYTCTVWANLVILFLDDHFECLGMKAPLHFKTLLFYVIRHTSF